MQAKTIYGHFSYSESHLLTQSQPDMDLGILSLTHIHIYLYTYAYRSICICIISNPWYQSNGYAKNVAKKERKQNKKWKTEGWLA